MTCVQCKIQSSIAIVISLLSVCVMAVGVWTAVHLREGIFWRFEKHGVRVIESHARRATADAVIALQISCMSDSTHSPLSTQDAWTHFVVFERLRDGGSYATNRVIHMQVHPEFCSISPDRESYSLPIDVLLLVMVDLYGRPIVVVGMNDGSTRIARGLTDLPSWADSWLKITFEHMQSSAETIDRPRKSL